MITTLKQVKAQSLAQKRNFVISTYEANTPVTPIKKNIIIKYDSYGVPSSAAIDLGLYGDRNVTMLTFDFADLVWTGATAADYQFNLFIDEQPIEEPENQFVISENFLVEYSIDTMDLGVGAHRFAVSILEKGTEGHNITTDQEIYICRSFVGTVNMSDFWPATSTPDYSAIDGSGLRRNAIEVMLADDGQFALKGAMADEHFSTDLGVQYDNFVSYVCFNSQADVTVKIKDLTCKYIVFQSNGESYWVKLKETSGHTHGDDDDKTLMAWVPPMVTQTVSNWTIYLVAQDTENNPTKQFVSHSIILAVIESPIAQEEIDKINGAKVPVKFNFSFLDSGAAPMYNAYASIIDNKFKTIGQIVHGIERTFYLYKSTEYGIELYPDTYEWSADGKEISGYVESITIETKPTTIQREYHANTVGTQASPEDIKQNYYAFTVEGERIDGAMEEANPSADVKYIDD